MSNTVMKNRIKHVVVLMLENRGFDHALGWLYDGVKDKPAWSYPSSDIPKNQVTLRPFEGLAGLDPAKLRNEYKVTEGSTKKTVLTLSPKEGASSPKSPSIDPHEDFAHIFAQMYNVPAEGMTNKAVRERTTKAVPTPPMNGFLQDFADSVNANAGSRPAAEKLRLYSEVMDTYTPEQLPVLSGLAKHYAVSDQWFCSVPTQTNSNRAFSLCGSARGFVNNNFYHAYPHSPVYTHVETMPADTRCIFDVLEENKVPWGYFWHEKFPPIIGNTYARTMFYKYTDGKYDARFPEIGQFFDRAAKGTLPAVSFIEPRWGMGYEWNKNEFPLSLFRQGNDMHPPAETTQSEDFVKQVYDALRKGPKWRETLFVITFDENGGTYDHVPPPAAPPTGEDKVPEGQSLDRNATREMDPTTRSQFGFTFDRFGIRIPTLLVSPYVQRSTVFRSPGEQPFDHTSVLATILKWQSIPEKDWRLGDRVAKAPTFDQVLTLTRPRTDTSFGAAPARGPGARPLKYGDTFVLRYIGSKWAGGAAPAKYIATSSLTYGSSSALRQYYPTMDVRAKAVELTLAGGKAGALVKNGAIVQIVTTEPGVGKYNVLGAWPNDHYLMYYTPDSEGQQWEARIFSSRDEEEVLHTGDEIFFLNRRFGYQRLLPDPSKPEWLTTQGGEWAIWKIEK